MPKRKRKTLAQQRKNSAGCMAVIAFVLVAIAGGFAFNTWSLFNRSEIVDAIVIDTEVIRGDDGTTYRPTFGFATPQGPVEASPKMAASSYDFAIGDAVEIRYDTQNPAHAIPTGDLTPWIIPIVIGGFGGIMVIIATLTFIGAVRTGKPNRKKPAAD